MRQFYRMAEEVGSLRQKPGRERRKARAPEIAEKSRRSVSGAVTGEVLDVARYISDVTAQLEALAIAAHLDQLAYFLGMAKAESEVLVRVSGVPERVEDESHEPTAGLHRDTNSFD